MKIYTRLCKCGKEFQTKKTEQIFCSKQCGYTYRKDRTGSKQYEKKHVPIRPKESLDEAISKIERYNKEHGTRLTYGQYGVMMRFSG